VLGETAVRTLDLTPPAYPEADTAIVLHYTEPNGLVRLTPNWEGYVGYAWTEINARGFRDRVFEAQPPEGVIRIAVLGDSYTMGDAVPLDATYPKQLENLLCKQYKCEVMNCGVSATNTSNQLETLRGVLRDYHPHLVVLGYNVNDFYFRKQTRFDTLAQSGYSYTVQSDGRVRVLKEFSGLQRVRHAIAEHSALYRWVTDARNKLVARGDSPAQSDNIARTQSWIAEGGHEKSFEALSEMKRLTDQEGVPFLVLILPGLVDMPRSIENMRDYPYLAEHTMMHEQMQTRGIRYVDLLSAFANEETAGLEAHPFDPHYSRHGNALVAEAAVKPIETEILAIQKQGGFEK
jgi:hypothetical protein